MTRFDLTRILTGSGTLAFMQSPAGYYPDTKVRCLVNVNTTPF